MRGGDQHYMKFDIKKILKPLGAIIPAVLSVVLALVIGAVIIEATGSSAVEAYRVLVRGAFGNRHAISETILRSGVLLLTGLSFAFVWKCGLINIGAEGQLFMGGAAGAAVGIYFPGLPAFILLPFALITGFVAGSLWGGLVGVLKARFNTNEIITTLMLNFIAILFVSFLVNGPMKDQAQTFPLSPPVADAARLPILLQGTRLHYGIFISLACLVFYWFFYRYTVRGYRLRAIGQNRNCAEYAGFNVRRNMFVALTIGGGFAGLGGAIEILGIQQRLFDGFAIGYGFDGVAAALLAAGHPVGMLLTSILFGALRSGGNAVQMFTSVPFNIVQIVQSVVIIAVLMRIFSKMPNIAGIKDRISNMTSNKNKEEV